MPLDILVIQAESHFVKKKIKHFAKKMTIINIVGPEMENNFVDRIDSVLKKKNLKRNAMCDDLKLYGTAITDWKRRGTLPAGDICLKIAKYLNVSIEWLVTGIEPEGYSVEERELIEKYTILSATQKHAIWLLIDGFVTENQKAELQKASS